MTAEATVSLSATPAVGTTLAVSQAAVTMTADASGNASASVDVTLTGGSQWSVSIFPSNRTTAWLSVSPGGGAASSHVALRASGAGLAKGVYRATLLIQSPNGAPQVLEVPVTFIVGASSGITISGVANGASFQTAFSPGMVLSVFGNGLAPGAETAASVPLPLTMQGVSATVNGIAAPLYYVSPGQLNIQIPYETGAGTAILGVNNNGQVAAYSFQVAASAPGIFTDQNGNIVPYTSGARGQTLLLFITGDGDVTPTLATGDGPAAGTPVAQLPRPRLPLAVTVGGLPATVRFRGIIPATAGVTQVNFTLPSGLTPGVWPVVVTVGGIASPPVNLKVNAAP